MLSEKQINALIKSLSGKLRRRKGKIEPADYDLNYQTAVEMAAQIAVHSQAGKFPEKLMRAKAPNETAEELGYRRDNFEPITKPYWDRGLAAINRIWAEQNYSINWGDEDVRNFFVHQFPQYGSVLGYFKSVVTPYKINDANAVLVIDIGDIPMLDNGDGTFKIDQSKELSPLCTIYGSSRVLFFDKDEYCLLLSNERSEVVNGDKAEQTGMVLYLLDTEAVYKISQAGEKAEYNFNTSCIYEHKLGYLPAKRLGGKQTGQCIGNDVISESYFMPAIPYLNKALKLDSTLDISISKMAYPIRAYYETACTNPDCINGTISYSPGNPDGAQNDASAVKKNCPVCHGTGKGFSFSPFRDYVFPNKAAGSNQPVPFPGFAYISPDPSILEFNQNKITSDIEKAFMFLNINVSLEGNRSNAVNNTKTATQAKIDREELFSFLLLVSEEVFALLKFTVDTIFKLRYPGWDSKIIINSPAQFEIRNVDELTAEIGYAQTNNVPDIIRRELAKEYMMLRFPAQKGLEKMIDVIFQCDPLAAKTTQDIVALRGLNLISQTDAVLHEHIFFFLEQKMSTASGYLKTDIKQIRADMVKMAEQKVRELK